MDIDKIDIGILDYGYELGRFPVSASRLTKTKLVILLTKVQERLELG